MMASETPTLNSDEIKRRIAAFYTAHAEHYTAWTQTTDFNKLHYLDKVLAILRQRPAPLKVLELGCGAGVPCTQILAAEKGVELTAVDIAEGQLEIARKEVKGENVKIVLSDMMTLEFETETLDAVVAFYSVMHLPRDEQVSLIGRIAKWLKPGGVFLVTLNATPNEGGASENVSICPYRSLILAERTWCRC
jgi:SAM-dependent methyltransferase